MFKKKKKEKRLFCSINFEYSDGSEETIIEEEVTRFVERIKFDVRHIDDREETILGLAGLVASLIYYDSLTANDVCLALKRRY